MKAAPAATPGNVPCSAYYGQHNAYHLPKQFGRTTFPSVICGYSADQLRSAYGYDRHNIGKGVTIALVEQGLTPDMFQTLQDYTRANDIQSPSASRYAELSLGNNTCGDPFNIEEQIDVETSYDMAPLANQLVVGGDSCNDGYFGLQALFDADIAILNGASGHPLAAIASNSWGLFDEESAPPNVLKIEQSYLVRSAAEGVSMLYSAGDSSGIFTPADSPYATTVGGTTLGIGRKDPREFETGWSTGISLDFGKSWSFEGEQGATGGGPSLLWAQPAYQRGVVPRSLAASPGNRRRLCPHRPRHQRDRRPVHRVRGRAAGSQPEGRAHLRRIALRRDQRRRAARRGHGGRRRAVSAPVRVPQPGALPAGRDEHLPRRAADHREDASR